MALYAYHFISFLKYKAFNYNGNEIPIRRQKYNKLDPVITLKVVGFLKK